MTVIELTNAAEDQVDKLFESLNGMSSLLADIQYSFIYDDGLTAAAKATLLDAAIDRFIGDAKVLKARIKKVDKAVHITREVEE